MPRNLQWGQCEITVKQETVKHFCFVFQKIFILVRKQYTSIIIKYYSTQQKKIQFQCFAKLLCTPHAQTHVSNKYTISIYLLNHVVGFKIYSMSPFNFRNFHS